MERRVDPLSLGAGLGLIATGAVLLADQDGAIDLSFGLFGAVLATFFAITGIALLWRKPRAPEAIAAPTASQTLTAPAEPSVPAPDPESDRLRDLYRGGFGIALIGGAALIVLSRAGALDTLGDSVLTIVVVILALALILAPFWWRLGRNLAAERAERIRSQERAEMAAHIHDSVLQTLTLVQKRADDPRAVAQLARAQERELRGWLFTGDRAPAIGQPRRGARGGRRRGGGGAPGADRGRGRGRRARRRARERAARRGAGGDGERRQVRAGRRRDRRLRRARSRAVPGVRARPGRWFRPGRRARTTAKESESPSSAAWSDPAAPPASARAKAEPRSSS